VSSALDVVVEAANGGADTVQSSVSFILGAALEHLLLTGSSAIDGQGNGRNNQLTGNSNNNVLDGGAGIDVMAGGAGNDTYTVDDAGDVVLELPGAGTDEVRSSVGYTLGQSVENLRLLGSSNIAATGNAEANIIIGNAGNNRITGSIGRDTMTGGSGKDIFMFKRLDDSGNTQNNADLISDFTQSSNDLIDLSAIDAVGGIPGDDAFAFIGTANFSAAGQARTFVSSGVTYVALNTDDNFMTTEMTVSLIGNFTLSTSDFML